MINLEKLREYCRLKKGTEESFPFDFSILALTVCGKIFLLTDINTEQLSINLKCDPVHALHLRTLYTQVTPGYHMNKKHWNTVLIDGKIPDSEIYMMIDQSYDLVVSGLKKSLKESIK